MPKPLPKSVKLNPRQQQYLLAIYQVDRGAEEEQKARYHQGLPRQKADEWRWLPYGAKEWPTPLFWQIDLVARDSGTGATFQALKRRGLILLKYRRQSVSVPCGVKTLTIPLLRLTPKGRKLARQILGEKPKPKLATGRLQEWHWEALSFAYQHPKGFDVEITSMGNWRKWERLRDFYRRNCGLIEKSSSRDFVISDAGRWYYAHYYKTYTELYPTIASPQPCPEDWQLVLPKEIQVRELGTSATPSDLDRVCHAIARQGYLPNYGVVSVVFTELNLRCSPQALSRWLARWRDEQFEWHSYDFRELQRSSSQKILVAEVLEKLDR